MHEEAKISSEVFPTKLTILYIVGHTFLQMCNICKKANQPVNQNYMENEDTKLNEQNHLILSYHLIQYIPFKAS